MGGFLVLPRWRISVSPAAGAFWRNEEIQDGLTGLAMATEWAGMGFVVCD